MATVLGIACCSGWFQKQGSDTGHTSLLSYIQSVPLIIQSVPLIITLFMEVLSYRKPESGATFLKSFGVQRHQ
jgi:hypothetical protein